MLTIDANGQNLSVMLFIQAFHKAQGLAPNRFITLRLHPGRYRELLAASEAPEVILLGDTPGPLGKTIHRVQCVKPPQSVYDGMAVLQDDKADPNKLEFQIHRVTEMEVVNLGALSDERTETPDDRTGKPQVTH